MKLKSIKGLILTLIMVLSFSTVALAATTGAVINKQVDGVKATVTFANEKIKTGSNEFTISLTDKDGQPISDSNLKVTVDMDRSSMGGDGMEKDKPMMIELKPNTNKGEYAGMVDLKNKGKWKLNATYSIKGEEKKIELNFDVMGTGPNYLIIGGFSTVILLILVIAVINKKKSEKTK